MVKKLKKLLQKIHAKIEIDVSATPIFKSDYGYTIRRDEVIEAEMIKKNVILNPALDQTYTAGSFIKSSIIRRRFKKERRISQSVSRSRL